MSETAERIKVIDGGARYGLHPTWEDLASISDFLLVEPDVDEAKRLTQKYADAPNVNIQAVCLGREPGVLSMDRRRHHGLSSQFQPNTKLLIDANHKVSEFELLDSISVPVKTIDSFDFKPDFLKLDVEGAELEALQGSTKSLSQTILGIRCEVQFAQIWVGAPFFGDIDAKLRECKFKLLNLDVDGRNTAISKFADPSRYGILLFSDAVWIASEELIDQRAKVLSVDAGHLMRIKLALFCLNNFAGDVAMNMLMQLREESGEALRADGQAILISLRKHVGRHLKGLTNNPSVSDAEVQEIYDHLFGEPFPSMHHFFSQ